LTHKAKAWVVMVAVFVASIATTANRFKVPPVLPVLMDDLQVDMVTGGWLMSLSAVSGIVLAIPAAFLLTRLGLRLTGLIAMGFAVVGAIVGAMAHNATIMLLSRVIEGVSISLIAVIAPTAISMWFEPQERGLPMGIWSTWVPVGNVIMFNIAHPLMNWLGWRAVWWFGAIFAIAALILVALIVTAPAESEGRRDNSRVPLGSFARMLFKPSTWLLALAFGAFAFSLLGYNTWAPTFLTDTLRIEAAAASAYTSLMFLAAIPANTIAGWAIGRIKNRYSYLLKAFLVTGVLFFWSFRLASVDAIVPYMIALGLASNFIPTATFTLAPETMPSVEYAGLALAIVRVGSHLGVLGGPPALAAILKTGNWTAGGTGLVIVMGIGTIISCVVSERAKASDQDRCSDTIPTTPVSQTRT
jgi:predicted MFS family arabinose efflux permease